MKRKYITRFGYAALATMALAACSTESAPEFERTASNFHDCIGGEIGALQMWRTAVVLKVDVKADSPVKLWLTSGEDQGLLYDYAETDGNGQAGLLMPQGKGTKAYIVSVCDHNKVITPVTLTGLMEQTVSIDLGEKQNAAVRPAKVAENSPLYGNSIAGGARYQQLTDAQKDEAVYLLENIYREHIPARQNDLNCDYELESKGDFEITWFAGNCMSVNPHILGYYYHSPGTYDDIKYVDLSETEVYDYIDGMAKVQYQVNEQAAKQYGWVANQWYDANFDMGDTFVNPSPNIATRRGDNAYNIIDVFKRFGNNISALRGITFTISVPPGMRVGFYDRSETVDLPSQYDRLERLGIKPYTTREKYKAMNFTAEAFNQNINKKGSYRSCIVKDENTYWIGMENDYTGGDLDCNDVMFAISADVEIHRPDIVEPDIIPSAEFDEYMPWTLAFEDAYRNADFDFNDAVIKITPDINKKKCTVEVRAAGTREKMYLHYAGPDGDVNLGEIHELLGGSADKEINTATSVAQTPFVKIEEVAWPEGYNMLNDAKRFYIEVKRGTCTDCADFLTLSDEAGQLPHAILVAGEWKWPMEGVDITKAYKSFADWARDNTKTDSWNWYGQPQSGMTVNF